MSTVQVGLIEKLGDKEYQALATDDDGSCKGCFGADKDGVAIPAICFNLPQCTEAGAKADGSEDKRVRWVDVSEVAY